MIDDKHRAYRIRILPEQIEAARRKLAALESEAERLGMNWLLDGSPPPPKLPPRGRQAMYDQHKSLGWARNLGAVRHERPSMERA